MMLFMLLNNMMKYEDEVYMTHYVRTIHQ